MIQVLVSFVALTVLPYVAHWVAGKWRQNKSRKVVT